MEKARATSPLLRVFTRARWGTEMTAYSSIVFESRDGVGHIVLDRPESANTLNATLSGELRARAYAR